jgi:hypothetical protein
MLEYEIRNNEIEEELQGMARVYEQAMKLYSEEMLRNIMEEYPRSREHARQDWTLEQRGNLEYDAVATSDIARWLYEGTGIYAGHGPIKPTHAKALRFFWDKVNAWTVWKGDLAPEERGSFIGWALARGMVPFLTWPKGMPGTDYLGRAENRTQDDAQRSMDQAMRMMGVS